jgi:hypothetical protein
LYTIIDDEFSCDGGGKMRTTININEQILAIAKQKAADKKTTLGAIIEDALRKTFSEKKKKSYVHLISAGESGVRHGVDLDNSSSLIEIMEE